MVAAAETIRLSAEHDSLGSRIVRALTRGPLNIFLAVIGLLWLVPTVGLFITSILPVSALVACHAVAEGRLPAASRMLKAG